MPESDGFQTGSANVFADLCLPDAEEMLAKAPFAQALIDAIEARGLTQAQAAQAMGMTQHEVSNIVRGRLSAFTVDRLMCCLTDLGRDVHVFVSLADEPPEHAKGKVYVSDLCGRRQGRSGTPTSSRR